MKMCEFLIFQITAFDDYLNLEFLIKFSSENLLYMFNTLKLNSDYFGLQISFILLYLPQAIDL